jgi:hypothetical protein
MKEGLAPDVVAQRIVEAIAEGETELAPVVFGQ